MGEGEEGFVMGFWPSKSLGPRPCRILFKVNIYMPRTQATLADNWIAGEGRWERSVTGVVVGGERRRRSQAEADVNGNGNKFLSFAAAF